jgi:hypothetical protein
VVAAEDPDPVAEPLARQVRALGEGLGRLGEAECLVLADQVLAEAPGLGHLGHPAEQDPDMETAPAVGVEQEGGEPSPLNNYA